MQIRPTDHSMAPARSFEGLTPGLLMTRFATYHPPETDTGNPCRGQHVRGERLVEVPAGIGEAIAVVIVVVICVILALPDVAHARQDAHMDRDRLRALVTQATNQQQREQAALDEMLSKRPAPLLYSDSLIALRQWIGVGQRGPVFRITHNREAAASARIDALLTGGRTGLDLSGLGQMALLIDNGHPRLTHVELAGRVDRWDEFSVARTHATHVAGTIAASGAWREARGMAPSALIRSHDWNNDVAEMAQAALDGIRVSNHSYGDPLGWTPNILGDGYWGWMGRPSISAVEDVRFGYYGDEAAAWDEVAHAAAHLVIVKSAGNERERQGPPDGAPHWVFDDGWRLRTTVRIADGGADGYDSIGDAGVAKNVLTVGAVEDAPWGVSESNDVVMTDFSGWGPVDDGRIKPDLVANGTALLSAKADSDQAYGASSGTSQAAPVVTGAAILLQELWEREFSGTLPLSSTIRGLLIHSADEAGSDPGPDYRFGWGHLNAERAALHLKQSADTDRILAPVRPYPVWVFEGELVAGETRTFELSITEAMTLKATLAWNDPAAVVRDPVLNDRASHLVHDLDLRASHEGIERLPWTLDPARPSAAAIAGVNTRDNIEQVTFDAEAGVFFLTISAPTVLSTPTQTFSLLVGTPLPAMPSAVTSTVAGTVLLGQTPVPGINIRVEGPVVRGSTTGEDGVFMIDELPAGTYTLRPDPSRFSFEPEALEITLPRDAGRVDFQATSAVETLSPRLFTSSRLLQSGEQSAARDVVTGRAGGLYGVELFFRNQGNDDLRGSSVVLDTDFDPHVAPWSGIESDRLRDLAMQQRLVELSDGRLRFRIPVMWISGDAPEGAIVHLPYALHLGSETGPLVHVDTLEVRVFGRDVDPPLALASVRTSGISYAPPGDDLEIRAGFLDGSPITRATGHLVDRFDTTRVLVSFPMRDSGDLVGDLDYVEGDGLYSARYYPDMEAHFQLRVAAEDAYGNVSDQLLPAWYASAPFEAGGSLLFLGWSDPASQTTAHVQLLQTLNEAPSWWESFVRGPISEADVRGFDRLWVGRHARPLEREEELVPVAAHTAHGGALHLFGREPVRGQTATDWLASTTGIRLGPTVNADTVRGVGSLEGLFLKPTGAAPPRALDLPADAVPLLVDGSHVLAARSENVVVSTIGVGTFASEEADRVLLEAFLYEETGRLRGLVAPELVVPNPDTLLQATTDSIRLKWDLQPWSTYRLQVSRDSLFSSVDVDVQTAETAMRIGPLVRGARYFWRVEARNPAGSSGWNTPRVFLSREANVAPEALLAADTVATGVRRPKTYLSFSRYFQDVNGDRLSYSATVDSAHVASVELIETGLYVEPLTEGTAVIQLTATDPEGLSSTIPIRVEVAENSIPVLVSWPDNPQYMIPGSVRSWPIEDLIEEPDGDLLSFWIFNDNPDISEARVENDQLIVEAKTSGVGFMALEAQDLRGGVVSASLVMVVRANTPPGPHPNASAPEFLPGDSIALALKVFVEDPEGDAVHFALLGATEDIVDPVVRSDTLFAQLTPGAGQSEGQTSVDVEATDSFGARSVLTIGIHVMNTAAFQTEDGSIPERFESGPSYPQPFSDRVVLPFALPAPARIQLDIFDSLGQHVARVAERNLSAGSHRLDWIPPDGLPGGNYYYQLQAGNRIRRGILVYVP